MTYQKEPVLIKFHYDNKDICRKTQFIYYLMFTQIILSQTHR